MSNEPEKTPDNAESKEEPFSDVSSSEGEKDKSSNEDTDEAPVQKSQDAPPSPTRSRDETAVDSTDEESNSLADVGFMFEGNQPTELQRFVWSTPQAKQIQVMLQVINDDPGAVQSGHYLWPGAQLLVEYLIQQESQLQPTCILELGAGCALAALAALQIWATSLQCLIVSDHDPGVLERARNNYESTLEEILDMSVTEEALNTAINDLGSIPVEFCECEWNNSTNLQQMESLLSEHTMPEMNKFDLILGTDLIYDVSVVQPLLTTAYKMLASDNKPSRFLLSQSFVYEEATEQEIDAVCQQLGLERTILQDDENGQQRIQEFQVKEAENTEESTKESTEDDVQQTVEEES